jgi:hypothetical protein
MAAEAPHLTSAEEQGNPGAEFFGRRRHVWYICSDDIELSALYRVLPLS